MEGQTGARVNEKGFTVLFEAESPIIDIVFIHGFTGDPKGTWTWKKGGAKSQTKHDLDGAEIGQHCNKIDSRPSKFRRLLSSAHRQPHHAKVSPAQPRIASWQNSSANGSGRPDVYWPRDLLPQAVPGARILTYGYDTKIRHSAIGVVSQNTVQDHGWNFLCAMEEIRRREPLRPLLLVAHSLGGLVVKEALRKSRDCELVKLHLHNIVKSTVGVLFFGTPHRGADPRSLIHHALTLLVKGVGINVNDKVVDTLMPGGEHLREMRDEFTILVRQSRWTIYCFQEEYGLRGLFGRKVVDDESSCLGDPTLETPRHISSNHMDMCRFSGNGDPEYQKVAAAIERILQNLPSKLQPGFVGLNGTRSINSAGPSIPDSSPHWSLSENNNKMDNFSPVPTISDRGQADARRNLIDLLRFDQIDARLWTLKTAQAKTCQWFLQKNEYVDWISEEKLQEHHGFLWIKGKPGAGKSILMKFLFSEAKNSAKYIPDAMVISFFFNARGNHLERSTVGLYRSVLLQIFEKAPDLQEVLDELDHNARRLIQEQGWEMEILQERLAKVVETLRKRTLICFIDALDECDEDQVRDMIEFFEEVGERAANANTRLHICFSSRHYPTIIIKRGLKVILEDEKEHGADITRYIKAKLRLGNSKQAEALRSDILEKSAGIFLWVALVIQILNKEYARGHVGALRGRLKDIPPGLDDLFEMILARDCENMEELQLCIQWVLFAMRPLKPQELYFAVHIGLDQSISTSWDTNSISLEDIHRFVQSSSKGLAEVTKSKEPTVQFIHESVRDFFLLKDGKRKLWSTCGEEFAGHSHEILRNCCLAQVNAIVDINLPLANSCEPKGSPPLEDDSPAIEDVQRPIQTKYPFLGYATTNVLMHSNRAQSLGVAQNAFVTAFPLQRWIKLSNLFERYPVRRYTDQASLLYILAERNCASLIKIHPRVSDHFDIRGERYSYPFIAAVVLRNEDAVRELVRAVLPDQPDALQHLRGDLDRFPHGRQFRCRKDHGLSFFVMDFNHEGIFRYLLETSRINIGWEDENGRTPLSWAAEKGHESVVKLLLEAGADLESEDYSGQTPLSWAAENGQKAVVKLLLEEGADLEAKTYSGRTPLSVAAKNGHKAVVELLLERGAELETKDNSYGQTPLSWAAENGHKAVVELLVERGADLDSKDNSGRTQLSWAAENGHKAVVELLVERGADLDSKDNSGRTPLSWAAENGYKAVVELLLERGAEMESKDNTYGQTPLSWAAKNGREAVVELLLERGAEIESKDNPYGQTPLSWAAGNGRKAMVELLLEKGADLDSKDNSGRTPLSWAAENGREAVVELLLKKGTDIESKDNSGLTPLLWAKKGGENAPQWKKNCDAVGKLLEDVGR